MRVEHLEPGRHTPAGLIGAVLARDLVVAGERWGKGRRLSAADLAAIVASPPGVSLTLLIPEPGEVHEDEAGMRLATAAVGWDAAAAGLTLRGPSQSRVDLYAAAAGIVVIQVGRLQRLNRIDAVAVFTVADGRTVAPGELVASAKVAPHLVPESVLAAAEAVARGGAPVVSVRPFRPARIAVVVKERLSSGDRERFEALFAARVSGVGATFGGVAFVRDEVPAVRAALATVTAGPLAARIVLTAGSASTDPGDAFFAAIDSLGGRVVRRGVPAHPGSMLWLARVGRSAVVGLPSCGAYSRATAADLLLPLLVAGFPASRATVARLAHGGILDRAQRFRFPAYARELEAPEG